MLLCRIFVMYGSYSMCQVAIKRLKVASCSILIHIPSIKAEDIFQSIL